MHTYKISPGGGNRPGQVKKDDYTYDTSARAECQDRQKEAEAVAYRCISVAGKDCDGCGACTRPLPRLDRETPERYPGDVIGFRCEECGDSAVYDGYYYEVEGMTLCVDCVDKLYRREAS